MYLDYGTIIFVVLAIVAVAGFLGFDRGRRVEREEQARIARMQDDFWRKAEALPEEDKAEIIESIRRQREENQ